MKIIHIADLHFGKAFYKYSMADEDQPYWVERFIEKIDEVKPDAIVIAGDIYDRTTPPDKAVELFDKMLTEISERNVPVMIISGNHDSGHKIAFGGNIFKKQNVYISGVLEKKLMKVTLNDEYGPVNFWLMPYVFPALVNHVFEDDSIRDYSDAVKKILDEQEIDTKERNVLVAHQNVVWQGKENTRGGSETMIGGVGAIDSSLFDDFTYVALGHIHAAQFIGRKEVRYAGSPLCYHFSEVKQNKKGPVLIELKGLDEKPDIETLYIEPLHPLREIEGTFEEIKNAEILSDKRNEYIKVLLKDSHFNPNAANELKAIFESHGSVMMEITNDVIYSSDNVSGVSIEESYKSIGELFKQFFSEQNNNEFPDEKENEIIDYLSEEVSRHISEENCAVPNDEDVDKLVEFILKQEEDK